MSDFLAEVDEHMRQERLANIWKKYGNLIITAILALIIGTGAYSYYKHQKSETEAKQTKIVVDLTQAPEFPSNLENANLDVNDDLKAVIYMNAANAVKNQGNEEQAQKYLEQIQTLDKATQNIKELSIINNPGSDIAVLEAIANREQSPWRYQARFQIAVKQAHEQKDYKAAIETLKKLKNMSGVPANLKDYADRLNHVYTLEMNKK